MTRQTRCAYCNGNLTPALGNDHYADLVLACLLCGREALIGEAVAGIRAAPKHRGGRPAVRM